VKNLVTTYRVLAMVVGVLLAFCSLVILPVEHAHSWFGIETGTFAEGGHLQHLAYQLSILWAVHGWVFIVYVVVAFLLARRAGWSVGFTIVALAAGLIPILIFWVEHRVVHKLKVESPELLQPAA
jgi:integral membrane protein